MSLIEGASYDLIGALDFFEDNSLSRGFQQGFFPFF